MEENYIHEPTVEFLWKDVQIRKEQIIENKNLNDQILEKAWETITLRMRKHLAEKSLKQDDLIIHGLMPKKALLK